MTGFIILGISLWLLHPWYLLWALQTHEKKVHDRNDIHIFSEGLAFALTVHGQFSYFPFVAISQPCSRLQNQQKFEILSFATLGIYIIMDAVICCPCHHIISHIYVCVRVCVKRVRLIDRCLHTLSYYKRHSRGHILCVFTRYVKCPLPLPH